MTDIPNSYEELEELITKKRQKKRPSILKTILIPVISAACIFIIWILYPVSAPDFSVSSLLPANTALSVEVHKPQKIVRHLNKIKFLPKLEQLPIWKSLAREYNTATGNNLQQDTTTAFQGLTSRAEDLFGMRNILLVSAGIGYNNQHKEIINAVVWLDNIGYLALKAVTMFTGAKETISGLKYYQIPLNQEETLYVSSHPKYPRGIIISTDLSSLSDFADNPDTKTELRANTNTAATLITGTVFPTKIPDQNIFTDSPTVSNKLTFTCTDSEIILNGSIKLADHIEKLLNINTEKHLEVISNRPGLLLNLNLSEAVTQDSLQQALTQISRNSPSPLAPLFNNFNPKLFTELGGNISLLLNEPQTIESYPANNSHLYLEVDDENRAHSLLFANLENMKKSLQNSNDLSQIFIGSQLKIANSDNSISLELPMLPIVTTRFNHIEDIAYSILSPNTTMPPLPVLTNNPSISQVKWSYSSSLLKYAEMILPSDLKNEAVFHFNSDNKVLISDVLNFLASSAFFSLCLQPDYDNIKSKRLQLRSELKLRNIK